MSLKIEKCLQRLELPPDAGDRELDYNNFEHFQTKLRTACKGSGALEVFQITVEEHKAGEVTVAQKDLDVLGQGFDFGGADTSNQDCLWVAEAAAASKIALMNAVEDLTNARKAKRNVMYYLLSLATSSHAHLYQGEPEDPVVLLAMLKQHYDPLSPQATDHYISRWQSISIANSRHTVPKVGTSFNKYCLEFTKSKNHLDKRGEVRSIINQKRAFLKGLEPVRALLDHPISQIRARGSDSISGNVTRQKVHQTVPRRQGAGGRHH